MKHGQRMGLVFQSYYFQFICYKFYFLCNVCVLLKLFALDHSNKF